MPKPNAPDSGFRLTADRQHLAFDDARLADRVADNRAKRDLLESESLLVGQEFGVVTDIKTAPNGNVWVVSLTKGAVYEIFNRQSALCATDVSASVSVTRSGFRFNAATGHFFQIVAIRNNSAAPIGGAVTLAIDNLSPNATLFNKIGNTACVPPLGNPFVAVDVGAVSVLSPGETAMAVLEFTNSNQQGISYTTRVLAGGGNR